ncbi:helix-turn-helix domain-containing protein [Apilactobacillus xinyiensis]|uniref:helix-turn-helix domain-containing protein n=1 Tax=Apilactobacillus xinyiensis TaxID=2841032 RepID=UPI00200EB52D|nr:helix-turn-helix domain-containing protein [Apilactobacillus xinyiensis]MCL0330845.1 hypothetical protein [Apilactobacillus xinyiensis]
MIKNRLKFFIDENNTNISKMINDVQVSRKTMYDMINNKSNSYNMEVWDKIANYFKTDINILIYSVMDEVKIENEKILTNKKEINRFIERESKINFVNKEKLINFKANLNYRAALENDCIYMYCSIGKNNEDENTSDYYINKLFSNTENIINIAKLVSKEFITEDKYKKENLINLAINNYSIMKNDQKNELYNAKICSLIPDKDNKYKFMPRIPDSSVKREIQEKLNNI